MSWLTTETLDARRLPVTLPEFNTRAPSTVDDLVLSPITTVLAAEPPMRTAPPVLPVPASKIRSPPKLVADPVPADCPRITVLLALFALENGGRAIV